MTTSILYATKMSTLRHWAKGLENFNTKVYIAKTKEELLRFFEKNKNLSILIIELSLDDDENEKFLELLKKEYSWVKVCVLSYYPSIKTASKLLGYNVRGYVNLHMNSFQIQRMMQSVVDGDFWYYPSYIGEFLAIPKKINSDRIGVIDFVSNLAISHTKEEEHIVLENDEVFENDLIITPYSNSYVEVRLNNGKKVILDGNDQIFIDKSVYLNIDINNKCFFDKTQALKILAHLGESHVLTEKVAQKDTNEVKKVIKKPIIQENKVKQKTSGIEAKYSGKFEEYEITPSKNLPGFFVIKDKIPNRDGSDLISNSIDKLIFSDVAKSYEDII